MARTQGERYRPAQQAVGAAQRRGQTNAREALRDFRAAGGTIRTQEWYRVWRGQLQVPAGATAPEERGLRGDQPPVQWTTNIGVTYLNPKTGKTETHWHQVITHGPRRMTDSEAMEQAVDQGTPAARKYGWTPVAVFVTSYDAEY